VQPFQKQSFAPAAWAASSAIRKFDACLMKSWRFFCLLMLKAAIHKPGFNHLPL
jgi:hypothetical protein